MDSADKIVSKNKRICLPLVLLSSSCTSLHCSSEESQNPSAATASSLHPLAISCQRAHCLKKLSQAQRNLAGAEATEAELQTKQELLEGVKAAEGESAMGSELEKAIKDAANAAAAGKEATAVVEAAVPSQGNGFSSCVTSGRKVPTGILVA